MKQAASVCRILLWIMLTAAVSFHALAFVGVFQQNTLAAEVGKPEAIFSPVMMLGGIALLILGSILLSALKKYRWIGAAILLLAGILLAINTVRLATHFPLNGTGAGESSGLTTGKLLLRHWSAELVPLFGIAAFVLESLPQWRHVPTARLLSETETPFDDNRPQGSVFVQCPRCEATFFNSPESTVFACPYCRKKICMPCKNWEGQKKKRSLKHKERKQATNSAETDMP